MMDRRIRRALIRPASIVILLGALLLPVTAGAQSTGTVAAQQELRIQELESQISALTGQVEQLSFQVRQLTEKLDRMASDTDFRLSQLEGGGQGDGSGAVAPDASSAPATGSNTMTTGDAGTAAPAPLPEQTGAAPTSNTGTAAASTPGSGPKVLGTLSQTDYEAQVARQQNSATAAQQAMDATNQQSAASQAAAPQDSTDQTAAVDTAALPGATPDEQYQYAFGLLRQNKYDDAERALRVFIDQNPEHQLTGNANYWLGETYYVRGDYKQAAITFAQGVKSYPQSGKAPDNMLKLGMALAALGQPKDACLAFAEVGKRYPQASDALKERVSKEQQRNSCK